MEQIKAHRNFKDLSGRKFGNLSIISRAAANSTSGRARWICRCDCGCFSIACSTDLLRGDVKSCGCLRAKNAKDSIVDISGKVFGRLSVIRMSSRADVSGEVVWECVCSCGKKVFVRGTSIRNGHTKSCGCLNKEIVRRLVARGGRNTRWRGGRFLNRDGYVLINAPDYPMANSNGVAFEHLVVMSRIIGRPVDTKTESVHHKNGIRNDNRPENLQLLVKRSHGAGQSVTDIVSHALSNIRKYAPELLLRVPVFSSLYSTEIYSVTNKRCVDKRGYARVYVGNGKMESEHRVVMSRMLERPLTSEESVHHKNGIRSDNNPSNLELMCKNHGSGQMVGDVIKHSLEVVAKYFPDCVNYSHRRTNKVANFQ